MGEDPEARLAVLQSLVRQRLDDVRLLKPGSPEYLRAADSAIEVTADLIDYEERLPVLLDEPPRRLSLLIVRWSAAVVGAVGLVLGLFAVFGGLSRWWLPVVVVVLWVAVGLVSLPVPAPCGPHPGVRPGAVLAAAGALALGLQAALRIGLWLSVIGLGLLVLGAVLARRRAAASVRPVRRPLLRRPRSDQVAP